MTTAAAARLYEAQHMAVWGDKRWAVYNPLGKPVDELPFIYGFNNGGSPGWMSACLIAEDGEGLGGHLCSSEGYMPHDLGVIEGARPDRHEGFRQHYPDGYRMAFVGCGEARSHEGIAAAIKLNHEKHEAAHSAPAQAPTDALPVGAKAIEGQNDG